MQGFRAVMNREQLQLQIAAQSRAILGIQQQFYPPLKESPQKHITEIVRDQGLTVNFSLGDALEWP